MFNVLALALALVAGCHQATTTSSFYHAVTPAPVARSDAHEVKVSEIAVGSYDEEQGRNTVLMWLGLDLHNASTTPWQIGAAHLAIVREGTSITSDGIMTAPFERPRTTLAIEPGARRRVWARFRDVRLDEIVIGTSGARSGRPVRLDLSADGAAPIVLADPARGDPAWISRGLPVMLVLEQGIGIAVSHAASATTLDTQLSVGVRVRDADLGVVGALRTGNESSRTGSGDAYWFAGAGLVAGRTLRPADMLVRPSVTCLVGRAGHGDAVSTTPLELDVEIRIAARRRDDYPFHDPDAVRAWGFYVKAGHTFAGLAQMPEPSAYVFGLGVTLRAGS